MRMPFFYAFSIWVGMGVVGIGLFLRKYLKNTTAAASLATIAVFLSLSRWPPRIGRSRSVGKIYGTRYGMNYLNSVGKNGIIFCNGDNDTFPLWYLHEVEEYRTDARACNLSYLQTEWYVDHGASGI